MHRYILILILLTALVVKTFSQANAFYATGYVHDSITKSPLENVNISIAGSNRGGITNNKGFFRIKIQSIRAVLYFSHMGYALQEHSVSNDSPNGLNILLSPEQKEIGEVSIYPDLEGVHKILHGDSLDVLDYEIWNDRILFVANPLLDPTKERIYVADLNGHILSSRDLLNIGQKIHFPDQPGPKKMYLYKDMFGEIQLLTQSRVWQVYLKNNEIFFLYPNTYDVCREHLFPIKGRINDKLFFQMSDQKQNGTFFRIRGTDTVKRVKWVHDEHGETRYLLRRNVKVPLIVYQDQLVLFDFFKNEICFYNEDGRLLKKVPTLFHTKVFYDRLQNAGYTLDKNHFTQKVFVDPSTERVYTLWKTPVTGSYTLKEINLETGAFKREIDIPNYHHIDKVQVINNKVYFIYKQKLEERFSGIFSMDIKPLLVKP